MLAETCYRFETIATEFARVVRGQRPVVLFVLTLLLACGGFLLRFCFCVPSVGRRGRCVLPPESPLAEGLVRHRWVVIPCN